MKNIFVIGLDEFNLRELQTIEHAEDYRFYGLLTLKEILDPERSDFNDLLAKAEHQLRSFHGSVDAIITHWDFPASVLMPILCRQFGVTGPSLESVLKCEHKYWSRLEQKKVIPQYIPDFTKVDPFDDHALEKIDLAYPFWVKPIKSYASQLGFKIHNAEAFHEAMQKTRAHISEIGDPYDQVLERAELPAEVAGVGGKTCIAEEIIAGEQGALEGYVYEGEVHIHGSLDMIREPSAPSFSRFEYPSRLPQTALDQAEEAARKFMTQIGFDNSGFNIEFFWDEGRGKIWVIEVNSRISQSHAFLFEKVNGISNHEVAVDLALGREPHFPGREGPCRCAAKFFLRKYEDAVVERVPTQEEINRIEQEVSDTVIQIRLREGMRLADLPNQDTYSYSLAMMYIAAQSREELLEKYQRCVDMLDFRFSEDGP